MIMNRLMEDQLQVALFVFSNRCRSRLKMLYWEGTGLWVLVKRLEKDAFAWPAPADAEVAKLQLTPGTLFLVTTRVDMGRAHFRASHER